MEFRYKVSQFYRLTIPAASPPGPTSSIGIPFYLYLLRLAL